MGTRDLVSRLVEAFNRHDATAFAECYASDVVVTDPQYPDRLLGAGAVADDVAAWFGAFPDVVARVERSVLNGEEYAIAYAMEGTHGGPLITPGGEVAPTHRPIAMAIATIGLLGADGRIAEERRYYDVAGIMAQLGIAS